MSTQSPNQSVLHELRELRKWIKDGSGYNRDDAPDEIARAIDNRIRQIEDSAVSQQVREILARVDNYAKKLSDGQPVTDCWAALDAAVTELLAWRKNGRMLEGADFTCREGVKLKVTGMEWHCAVATLLRELGAEGDDVQAALAKLHSLKESLAAFNGPRDCQCRWSYTLPEAFCVTRPGSTNPVSGYIHTVRKWADQSAAMIKDGEVTTLETLLARIHKEHEPLRRLIWLSHGCDVTNLYGDDGEMQCSKCKIDFLREDPKQIEIQLAKLGLELFWKNGQA